MKRVIGFVVSDIIRNRIVFIYALLLAVLSWSVFGLEDNSSKGVLTVLNLVILVVPLMSIVFSTIYLYNSSEFIELLLSQPIRRARIWKGLFAGLQLSLCSAFIVGTGLPVLMFVEIKLACILLLTGMLLTSVFVSLAFLASVYTSDKAKGIGLSILLWLFFSLLFDGILLFIVFQFSDYPIEKTLMVITALNPIDISRLLVMLQLDVSALMGYAGAVFRAFFGTSKGILISFFIMGLWAFLPFLFSLKKFKSKDL